MLKTWTLHISSMSSYVPVPVVAVVAQGIQTNSHAIPARHNENHMVSYSSFSYCRVFVVFKLTRIQFLRSQKS
jgi:hypothetical protein